jgi:type I restriction enzyme M protein
MARTRSQPKEEALEPKLWKAADKLRKNMDAAEYKHIVLGLIFLKYISDAFTEMYDKLKQDKHSDPEDRDEYRAENVFYVPSQARWTYLQGRAKLPEIGRDLDNAMDAIESDNPSLKGVLPKQFARPNLDKNTLGGLIDLIGTIALGTSESIKQDVLGKVYEYFLGQFALAEGKKGGQFYTPRSVVQLLVEMIEPYEGRVFDPCCGSGGMFVQSEKFVEAHRDQYNGNGKASTADLFNKKVSIYGQESNQTTWRLCKMNLAIRGVDSSNVKWNTEGSFLRDAHPDLKADFILANPPFNDSDWSGELLRTDARWQYGTPPEGNANYAWLQHFIYHLSPSGTAGVVLAKGSLTSKSSGEGDIRQNMIEAKLIDCIVNLPAKLFLNTQIPACLWFISRSKAQVSPLQGGRKGGRNRENEVLFIDARNLGHLINRRTKEFTNEDIAKIADTYHAWRSLLEEGGPKGREVSPAGGGGSAKGGDGGGYQDIPGFCKSATLDEIRDKGYVLTPGRYVGLPEEEDDFNFPERFGKLKAELEEQMKEEEKLNKAIMENFEKLVMP